MAATTHELDQDKDLFDALRCFSFAQQYYPMELAVFEKNFSSLGGGGRSTENKNFRDALLFFRQHFYIKLLPGIDGAKTELERYSPLDIVERVGETSTEEIKLRKMDRHEFAERLVINFQERLKLQLNKGEDNALIEGVENSLSKAASRASSTQELHDRVEEGLTNLLLAHPDTQQKFVNNQQVARGLVHEVLDTGKQPPFQQILFSDPVNATKAVVRALSPEVPDKELFFRVAAALPMKHNESVDEFLAGAGRTTRAAIAATAELPITDITTPPGSVLPFLVQTGVGKLVAPVFAALPQKIKDAVAVAAVGRAWENAVGQITNNVGGALTPGLTQVIQQGNKYLGKTSGGPSFLGAITDIFSPLLVGPIEPALYNYLQAHRTNDLLPINQRFFGDTTALSTALSANQTQDGRGAVYLLFAAVVSGGQREAYLKQEGSGSAWVVDLGSRLLGALTTKKAGGGVTGKFFSKILGFFGVRAGTQAVAGMAGGVAGILSGGWGWAITIAGGLFAGPLFKRAKKWAGGILGGGITNAKVARDAITSLVGAGGATGSAQKEQRKTDFVLVLFFGACIFILFFVYLFQGAKQNTDLFVASQEAPDFSGESNPAPDLSLVASECKGLDLPAPPADGVKTTQAGGRTYAFPVAPYDRTYYTCGHWDGGQATDIGINGVGTGKPHAGIAVVAYTDGVIGSTALNDPKGGKYVILNGSNGESYYYAHNCSLYVKKGDHVSAGQVIAATGNTGSAAGTPEHLHFAMAATGGDFYNGGDTCPAKDFKEKFGISKCGAAPLCPSSPPNK